MNIEIINAAERMGYRKLSGKVYAKPVGYHILSIIDFGDKVEIQNMFLGIKGQKLIWNKSPISVDNPLCDIKNFETFTEINVGTPHHGMPNTNFDFLTKEQEINRWLSEYCA